MTDNNKKYLILLAGPTAVGKTDLAIDLAKYYNTVIVSADSRQVFKEMSIGTAVPSQKQLKEIEHFMIQNHSVIENYNASQYEFEVLEILQDLFQKHDFVIFTGGSGLYINAVLYGIDDLPSILPEVREKWKTFFEQNGIEALQQELQKVDVDYYRSVDLQNPKRILKALEVFTQTGKMYSGYLSNSKKLRPFTSINLALNRDRGELYNRINERVIKMLENGLEQEVKSLSAYRNTVPLKTVGYREIFEYFDQKISLDEAVDLIQRNSRKYARKQITWFRREKSMQWFHPEQKAEIIKFINQQKKKNDL